MFIRYKPTLCLNDLNDVIEIKYDNLVGGFVATLELNPTEIVYKRDKTVQNISIQENDSILMAVSQSATTDSCIYVKKPTDMVLIFGYSITEPNANIEDTKAYEMSCYLSKRIAEYYKLSWTFDANEKVQPNKLVKILKIIIWVSIILGAILKLIHK